MISSSFGTENLPVLSEEQIVVCPTVRRNRAETNKVVGEITWGQLSIVGFFSPIQEQGAPHKMIKKWFFVQNMLKLRKSLILSKSRDIDCISLLCAVICVC